MRTTADALLAHVETLVEESFGPASIVVEYDDLDQVRRILDAVRGSLTVTFQTSDAPSDEERDAVLPLVRAATGRAGRIVFNGWPTGVAVTPAQQHGGPYPATTAPSTTSVGTAAIARFLRPVAFQNAPDGLLPDALRDANPLGVPRIVHDAGESATWGREAP